MSAWTFMPIASGRLFALIDCADYEWASKVKWATKGRGYVGRTVERVKAQYLHRTILGLAEGDELQGDHRNLDRLDNRRCNLRPLTGAENAQNKAPRSACGIRGVSWDEARGKWKAHATVGGKTHWLGRFDDLDEAAEAAAACRRQHLPCSEEKEVAA